MTLSTEDIEKLAVLSRIQIETSSIGSISERLHSVLDLVNQLGEADTSMVEPMAHPLSAIQRARDDGITETDMRERFQSLSQHTHDGLYLVPKVID